MPLTLNGSGTIAGLSAGGLPDACITTDDIAANAVTFPKIGTTEQGQLCKAWVNFNGTGTVAIRASYNVSSITDNGVGNYKINFATALVDANYCCVDGQPTSIGSPSGISNQIGFNTYTTTGVNVTIENSGNGTYGDKDLLNVAIFR
jgi:hypothetical protein